VLVAEEPKVVPMASGEANEVFSSGERIRFLFPDLTVLISDSYPNWKKEEPSWRAWRWHQNV
jgi:hypothetical protein